MRYPNSNLDASTSLDSNRILRLQGARVSYRFSFPFDKLTGIGQNRAYQALFGMELIHDSKGHQLSPNVSNTELFDQLAHEFCAAIDDYIKSRPRTD